MRSEMIGTLLNDGSGRECWYRLLRRGTAGRCSQRKLPSLLALRRSHQLPDRHLAYAQPLRDRTVAQSLALESLDDLQPLPRKTSAAATPTLRSTQPHHPGLQVAFLVSANGALGFPECLRHFGLLCKTRVDQHHHRIRFSYRIRGTIVVHR